MQRPISCESYPFDVFFPRNLKKSAIFCPRLRIFVVVVTNQRTVYKNISRQKIFIYKNLTHLPTAGFLHGRNILRIVIKYQLSAKNFLKKCINWYIQFFKKSWSIHTIESLFHVFCFLRIKQSLILEYWIKMLKSKFKEVVRSIQNRKYYSKLTQLDNIT